MADAYRGAGHSDEEVLAECRRAEPLLAAAHNWESLVFLLSIQAASLNRLSRHTEAEETAYRAVVVAKQTGREVDVLRATLILSDTVARMGRLETATELRRQVFQRARAADDPTLAAWAAETLARSELDVGRLAAAMSYGDWIEDNAEHVADVATRGTVTLPVLAHWSRTELRLGNVDEALRIAKRAAAYAVAHPEDAKAHLAPLQLAHVQVRRKRWDEVIDLVETSLPAGLAVLSACQSGGETVAAGEGLLGLTRAFFRAGVTRVLCTTWQVADDSTAQLMVRFHRARVLDEQSDAEALRQARLALLRSPDTAHPYYWAGFQLWGPREP